MEALIIIDNENDCDTQHNLTKNKGFANYLRSSIGSSIGRSHLGQSMASPIRIALDYQGIARRFLVVDPLPQAAMLTYDRDIDDSAIILNDSFQLKEFIFITSGNIIWDSTPLVRRSLPYQAIARRASFTHGYK